MLNALILFFAGTSLCALAMFVFSDWLERRRDRRVERRLVRLAETQHELEVAWRLPSYKREGEVSS